LHLLKRAAEFGIEFTVHLLYFALELAMTLSENIYFPLIQIKMHINHSYDYHALGNMLFEHIILHSNLFLAQENPIIHLLEVPQTVN
jgi:hypothetical protein